MHRAEARWRASEAVRVEALGDGWWRIVIRDPVTGERSSTGPLPGLPIAPAVREALAYALRGNPPREAVRLAIRDMRALLFGGRRQQLWPSICREYGLDTRD